MTRARIIAVATVSVCLLSGAPRQSQPVTAASATGAAADPSALGAERIADVLRDVNPVLPDRDLRRIAHAILESSARYDLDPELVTAVMLVESGARPWVRSPKGAVGLMQVMPHMAVRYDFAGDLTRIESNIEIGCLILADNIRRLGEEDGISAYFWGSEIRGVAYLRRVLEARESLL